MTITITGKRNRETSKAIRDGHESIVSDAIATLNRAVKAVSEARTILEFVNEFVPVSIDNYWDMIGTLEVAIERRYAKRVVKKLREAGIVLGEAGYSLRSDKDENGNEQVNVIRRCERVEGYAPTACVDRIVIQWTAPYKAGSKCKIVETNNSYTSRSLVCG